MMRFYCGVLRLSHVWHTFLLECFAFGSRLLFAAERQTGRLAIGCVPVSAVGRDRQWRVLECWCGYRALWVHFGFVRFFMAISTGYRDAGNEERGWRQGASGSLRNRIGFVSLSAGSTLGLRAPDCAKESSTLWTLFTLRRGWVGAYSPRRHPGTRKDLTGSNLWPVRSGCIAMLSTRSNVQTRAALKRRRVGLRARSGEEAGTAGLSGLSSRCGGVGLVRIRRAVTRVQRETRPSPIYARPGRAV